MDKDYINDGSLSEKWKYRFSFYDQHGFPGFWKVSPEYKQAFKAPTTVDYSNKLYCLFLLMDLFVCTGSVEKSNYSYFIRDRCNIYWSINRR